MPIWLSHLTHRHHALFHSTPSTNRSVAICPPLHALTTATTIYPPTTNHVPTCANKSLPMILAHDFRCPWCCMAAACNPHTYTSMAPLYAHFIRLPLTPPKHLPVFWILSCKAPSPGKHTCKTGILLSTPSLTCEGGDGGACQQPVTQQHCQLPVSNQRVPFLPQLCKCEHATRLTSARH